MITVRCWDAKWSLLYLSLVGPLFEEYICQTKSIPKGFRGKLRKAVIFWGHVPMHKKLIMSMAFKNYVVRSRYGAPTKACRRQTRDVISLSLSHIQA